MPLKRMCPIHFNEFAISVGFTVSNKVCNTLQPVPTDCVVRFRFVLALKILKTCVMTGLARLQLQAMIWLQKERSLRSGRREIRTQNQRKYNYSSNVWQRLYQKKYGFQMQPHQDEG